MAAGDLITDVLQMEWRGTLWGWPVSSVGFTDLSGWLDAPDLRGENAARPGRHGAYPGQKRAGERTIEVELTVLAEDYTALQAIRNAANFAEDPQEEALVAWFGTDTAQLVYARLERCKVPTDRDWSLGHHRATLQWVATDPRRYSVAEHSLTLGLPSTATGGLSFPLAFPLSFGSGSGAGQLSVLNAGPAATWPILEIAGPVTGPTVINASTGQQLVFDPTFVIDDGQTLVIDTDARAVTVSGVSRRNRLMIAQWFPLAAGTTAITWATTGLYDPGAGLTVRWRDAWMT